MDNLIKEIRSNHSDMYVDNTLAAIRVSGKDNKKFLQGQLTNDTVSYTHLRAHET